MKRILILTLLVAITLLLLFSIVYLWSEHDYDMVKVDDIITDSDFVNITYDQKENILNEDVLGILKIEKIGLIATVKEGSTKDILKEYVGHISETSKYDGNIGLAAHNRLNKYSYFARINELEKGDIITYTTKFGTNQYKVNKKIVVLETDWSILQDDGTNKLTLITCIAEQKNQRLCVQATQI